MRAVLVALPLLLSFAVQAAEPAPLSLELAVVPEKPRPGQRVFWRLSLRNTSGRRLFVPVEVKERLGVGGTFLAPDQEGGYGFSGGEEEARLPTEWIDLPPNGSLEQTGDAGELFPACRGGCPEGRVLLGAMLRLPLLPAGAELPGDHVVPAGLRADTEVSVEPAQVEYFACDGVRSVAATVLAARAVKQGLRLRVRLENRTGAPLWVPKPSLLVGSCSVESATPDGSPGVFGATGGERSPPENVDERGLVLLPAKGPLEAEVTCSAAQLPKQGTIRLTLDGSTTVLVPRRALVPPFVWTGRVEAPPFVVGAR